MLGTTAVPYYTDFYFHISFIYVCRLIYLPLLLKLQVIIEQLGDFIIKKMLVEQPENFYGQLTRQWIK